MCTKYDKSAEKRQAFLKSVYMYSAHGCMQRCTIDCGTPMYIHIYTISSPRTTNVDSYLDLYTRYLCAKFVKMAGPIMLHCSG